MSEKEYMDVTDVAEMFGVSPKTIYGWVHAKRIPHVKLSRTVLRFRRDAIDEWARGECDVPVGGREDRTASER